MARASSPGVHLLDHRFPRQPAEVHLAGAERPVVITKGWVVQAGLAEPLYRRALKHLTLAAAAKVALTDARSRARVHDEEVASCMELLERLLAGMEDIHVPAPIRASVIEEFCHPRALPGERYALVKFGHRFHQPVNREFAFEGGQLIVNKRSGAHRYALRDAQCLIESRAESPGQPKHVPSFENGFNTRIRLTCSDRNSGPMFLYAKSKEQADSWCKTIRMAKHLLSSDESAVAVRTCLRLLCAGARRKGWDVLVGCYHMFVQVRADVRKVGMTLVRSDLARGWTKLRAAYKCELEMERARLDHQRWTANLLSKGFQNAALARRDVKIVKSQSVQERREQYVTKLQELIRKRQGNLQRRLLGTAKSAGIAEFSRMRRATRGRRLGTVFEAVSCNDALRLLAAGDHKPSHTVTSPSRATYCEMPMRGMHCYVKVSDCLSMLVVQKKHLDHTANFANLNRISAVVLNSNRQVPPNKSEHLATDAPAVSGSWFTLYGPRLCWGRRLVEPFGGQGEDKVRRAALIAVGAADDDEHGRANALKVVGARDGFEMLPRFVSGARPGANARWLRVSVLIKDAHLHKPPKARTRSIAAAAAGDAASAADFAAAGAAMQRETRASVSLFGRRHESLLQTGDEVDYALCLKVALPMPSENEGVDVFDESIMDLDIIGREEGDVKQRLLWTARTELWRMVSSGSTMPNKQEAKLSLLDIIGFGPDPNKKARSWRLSLAPVGIEAYRNASVAVELTLEVSHSEVAGAAHAHTKPCISPELLGYGSPTALFTSHQDAWRDMGGTLEKTPDHVPNFFEVDLAVLRLAEGDGMVSNPRFEYIVELSCYGASTASDPVYQPLPDWAHVLSISAGEIAFAGCRLNLALPPGFWTPSLRKPEVELHVLRRKCVELPATSFANLTSLPKAQTERIYLERVYRGIIDLSGVPYSETSDMLNVRLERVGNEPPRTVARDGESCAATAGEAQLSLRFTLRDRDMVWLSREEGQCKPCIGDQAVLIVERLPIYPDTRAEFTRNLWPGEYNWAAGGQPCVLPLREPCTVHEFEHSGLEALREHEEFKEQAGHTWGNNPVPYKFMLPASEVEFHQRRLPGVFRRIVDQLAVGHAGQHHAHPRRPVVERLTHVRQPLRCTCLAMYPGRICDVELAGDVLEEWERNPHSQFFLPGEPKFVQSCGERQLLLLGVPVSALRPLGIPTFNLYDAACATAEDAAAVAPDMRRCVVRPRKRAEGLGVDKVGKPLFPYSVTAGPLPNDCSPDLCQYEWSICLCADSAAAMYSFVSELRHCIREYHARRSRPFTKPVKPSGLPNSHKVAKPWALAATSASANEEKVVTNLPPVAKEQQPAADALQPNAMDGAGCLDVLLVEARRLKPMRQISGASALDGFLAGVSPKEEVAALLAEQELNVCVAFKMFRASTTEEKASTLDSSPTVMGTRSPCWAKLDELKPAGGWRVRTRKFDPANVLDLILEIDVRQVGITQDCSLGVVRLPLSKGNYFTDPASPFRNLWLPLTKMGPDGHYAVVPFGAVHIMTLWAPFTARAVLVQRHTSPFAYFKAEVAKSLATAEQLCEPMFGTLVRRFYNPNLCLAGDARPIAPYAELASSASELASLAPYLQCIEQRVLRAWCDYGAALVREGLASARLGELRLQWLDEGEEHRVLELERLVREGVPRTWRRHVWPDLTLSTRVSEKLGGLATFQENLTSSWRRVPAATLAQLHDDSRALAECDTRSASSSAAQRCRSRHHRAQNVCTALLTLASDLIAYCEGLLVLAYHILLSQESEGGLPPSNERDAEDQALADCRAFWLLYTLVASETNGAYRDYYLSRRYLCSEIRGVQADVPVGVGGGAMQDILLLECAVAVHEPELWVRLSSLGFQFSIMFYPAFMRLFANVLPTPTLFRFWDFLLAESSNPKAFPHPRHCLVDLAFIVLQHARAALLLCMSALEVQEKVAGLFASMFDPQLVVDLAAEAQAVLWGGLRRKKVLKLWQQSTESKRNRALSQPSLRHGALERLASANLVTSIRYTGDGMLGLSASAIAEAVIPAMRGGSTEPSVAATGVGLRAGGASAWVLPLLLPANAGGGSGSYFANRIIAEAKEAVAVKPQHEVKGWSPDLAKSPVRPLPEQVDEISRESLAILLQREIPSWRDHAGELFDAFCCEHGTMSLNEFLVALIVSSRGTVAEKAAAIFDVYAYRHVGTNGELRLYHRLVTERDARGSSGGSEPVAFSEPARSRKVIDLRAIRVIVEALLSGGMQHLSRRQLVQIADASYHRTAATAGILAAVLVAGSDTTSYASVAALQESGKPLLDVTHQLTAEFDRQVSVAPGGLPLLLSVQRSLMDLRSLRIEDPFVGSEKLLWLWYVSAGDGERCKTVFRFGPRGEVMEDKEVVFDWDGSVTSQAGGANLSTMFAKLTKDEFVACTLASPLISDALRMPGNAHVGAAPAGRKAAGPMATAADGATESPLTLDVTVGTSLVNGDVPIHFGDHGQAAPQRQDGAAQQRSRLPLNYTAHGVDVYLGDTVDDFKSKVELACHKLAEEIEGEKTLDDAMWAEVERRRGVRITGEHTVLLFDPKTSTAPLVPSSGLGALDALRLDVVRGHDDPANWRTLDPSWTLAHCAARFGSFRRVQEAGSGAPPPLLRVVRMATAPKASVALEALNDLQHCFAYARYSHTGDGGSVEWRPCVVHGLPRESPTGQSAYRLSWAASTSRVSSTSMAEGEEADEVFNEADVLLAHAAPAIFDAASHRQPSPQR